MYMRQKARTGRQEEQALPPLHASDQLEVHRSLCRKVFTARQVGALPGIRDSGNSLNERGKKMC